MTNTVQVDKSECGQFVRVRLRAGFGRYEPFVVVPIGEWCRITSRPGSFAVTPEERQALLQVVSQQES